MRRPRPRRRRLLPVAMATAAVLVPMGSPGVAHATTAPERTSVTEAARVDAVPTPRLGWYSCYQYAECATVRLPMDYDQPNGAKTEVAVLRVKARNQANKVGSLFLNPGGPGGSGTGVAHAAPFILGPDLLDAFDIVGFDPRGTNFSDQVGCFTSNAQQSRVLSGLFSSAFPVTRAEQRSAVSAARQVGRSCSTTGQPLAGSMSTAEVARDMDVLRRAVGDDKLSYLGWSYGSYLGQVYANMFPDRVRAVTIDGVLDPIAWAGTAATASQPQTDRLHSADGAYKALHEILVRCDQVGASRCAFSAGDPVERYDVVAERLKAKPLVEVDPFTGLEFTFGYADLVASSLFALYGPFGYEEITVNLADLYVLTDPATAAPTDAAQALRVQALRSFSASLAKAKERAAARSGYDFPYDNSFEAFASVLCTDGLNPADAGVFPAKADAADRRAKYFGALWTWASVQCASRTWTAADEDAYRGPFNRNTASPVLVVGSIWDPATNYQGAVTAANLLPNSRLLSSNNWGHTAYGSSLCVNTAIEQYLLRNALPAEGTTCEGDIQPFMDLGTQKRTAPDRQLPPVVAPLPRAPSSITR